MKKLIAITGLMAINILAVPQFFKDCSQPTEAIYANASEEGPGPGIDEDDIMKNIESITENRDFYDDEKKRMGELLNRYYNNEIRPVVKMEDRTEKDNIYYDTKTNTIIFPEKTMTDDELLTLIDFSYSMNQFLSKSISVPVPDKDRDISSHTAIRLAREEVRRFYNVDVSDFTETAAFNEYTYISEVKHWTIVFANDDKSLLFFVDVDAESGRLMYADKYDKELWSVSGNAQTANEAELAAAEEISRAEVEKLAGSAEIKSITQYSDFVDDSIYNILGLETGEFYEVSLAYPSLEKAGWSYYENEQIKQARTEDNVGKLLTLLTYPEN